VEERDEERDDEPDDIDEMGEYAIVGFELADEDSEQLIYYTVDYDYATEEEAWAALEDYAAEGLLDPGDYGVIKVCSAREPLSIEGGIREAEPATDAST
jgi:hypothetical protein